MMWPRSNLHSRPEISGDPYNHQEKRAQRRALRHAGRRQSPPSMSGFLNAKPAAGGGCQEGTARYGRAALGLERRRVADRAAVIGVGHRFTEPSARSSEFGRVNYPDAL